LDFVNTGLEKVKAEFKPVLCSNCTKPTTNTKTLDELSIWPALEPERDGLI